MGDTGNSYLVGVCVSRREKEAIRRRAKEENKSQSSVAREMMQRGDLERLVAFYFGDDATIELHEQTSEVEAQA